MSGGAAQEEGRAAFGRAVAVSRETLDRLDVYAALLRKWNGRINLVARSTLDDLWSRHFLDSAQLVDLAPAPVGRWVDLGSGGGFPGLVVAAVLAERQPDAPVVLVESDARKSVFLNEAARAMDLTVQVIAGRAEAVAAQNAAVVSARALAPLVALFPLVHRHLGLGGIALLPKGARWRDELASALVEWRATVQTWPSQLDRDSVILRVGDLARI